jgi:hypothetical protein
MPLGMKYSDTGSVEGNMACSMKRLALINAPTKETTTGVA